MATLVLDIETVADPCALAAHGDAVASMAAKREQDVDTFGALCPPLARVVAVAFHLLELNKSHVVYDAGLCGLWMPPEQDAFGVEPVDDEPALLGVVARIVSKHEPIITYAGRGFDLPVLIHRAKIHGVVVPPLFNRAMAQKPWQHFPHLDLQNAVTFGTGSRYPLAAFTIGYGVGNPKAGGDGSDVARLVRERRAEELATYAVGDVEKTAAFYRRWVANPEAMPVAGV